MPASTSTWPAGTGVERRPRHESFVGLIDELGAIAKWQETPKDAHPWWLPAIGFAQPGVLLNAPEGYAPLHEFRLIPGQETVRRLNRLGPKIGIEHRVDSNLFARVIAKIAHSFAVAMLGLNGFDPILQGVILGTSTDLARYVGGPPVAQDDRRPDPDILHSLRMVRQGPFWVVRLRLFAFLEGTQTYVIVVGRAR